MLHALKTMHADVSMQVRTGGALGPAFPADMGVKQGDPLSPLLFGLFIDRLEGFLKQQCPGVGALVAGRFAYSGGRAVGPHAEAMRLALLLYADDAILLSDTPEGLQQLLDALQRFCRASRLAVNVDKSVAMCFWQAQWAVQPPAGWAPQYAGEPLPVADQYVYLGVRFEGAWARDSLVKANMERACLRATAMSAAVHARC
jgi:hypothetical protein